MFTLSKEWAWFVYSRKDSRWVCIIDGEYWAIYCRGSRFTPLASEPEASLPIVFLDLPSEQWTQEDSVTAFRGWYESRFGRPMPPLDQSPHIPHLDGARQTASELEHDLTVQRAIPQRYNSTVYFLEAIGVNRVKIGWSRSLAARQKNIQACCPVPLQVIHTESGEKPREQALHLQFANDRCNGEWFVYSNAIRDYISSRSSLEAA
jgi:hypothetical protein